MDAVSEDNSLSSIHACTRRVVLIYFYIVHIYFYSMHLVWLILVLHKIRLFWFCKAVFRVRMVNSILEGVRRGPKGILFV